MKYLFSILFYSFFSCSALFAEGGLGPSGIPYRMGIMVPDLTGEECTICKGSAERKPTCPTYMNYMVNQTMKASIYSGVVGKRINEVCVSKSFPLTRNSDKINTILKDIYKSPMKIDPRDIDQCMKNNRVDGNLDNNKKLLMSYTYALNKNITDLQAEKFREIALNDQFLGKPILNGVHCSDHESLCNSLKKCNVKNNSFNETVDFAMVGLKEVMKLNQQKQRLSQQSAMSGVAYNNASINQTIVKDIDAKMAFVMSMNPWLKGDILKKNLTAIQNLIVNNKEAQATKLFKEKFREQVEDARKLQVTALVNMNLAQDCLLYSRSCHSSMFKNMNGYFVKPDSSISRSNAYSREDLAEANVLKASANCMASQKGEKQSMDERNMMIASTAASFAVGGAGGIVRLGVVAARFYQGGNIVKGVGSATALAGQFALATETFGLIKEKCKKGIAEMNSPAQQGPLLACSAEAKGMYRVANLKSCIADIAMTTIPGALSLKGAGGAIKGLVTKADDAVAAGGSFSAKAITEKVTNNFFSAAEKKQIAETLEKFNLTKGELDDVLAKINVAVKSPSDKNQLRNYVNFVHSLKPDEQVNALKQLQNIALLSSRGNPGGYVAQFYQKEKKFNVYETFKQKIYEYELKRKGRTPAQAKVESFQMAAQSRAAMQKRYYSCQSKTITPEHKTAAKRYLGLSTSIGIAGTVNGNYSANKDKFENNKLDWFGKLGYDIAIVMIMSKINAKMVKASPDGIAKRYLSANANFAVVGGLDAVVYSRLYGVTEKEAEVKLEQIKNSPEAMKELKVLEKYLDKNDFAGKFEEKMVLDFKNILSSPKKEEMLGKPPYKIGSEEFPGLTPKDLDNPAIKQKVLHALIREMNSGAGNPIISTGDLGLDRWSNDRAWNAAIGVPKGMVTGMIMYQILCMGADRPFASLGVATGFQFINQFMSGSAYYQFRREMIGQ